MLSVPKLNTRITEDEMIEVLSQYEVSASEKCRDLNVAEWNYNTDIENNTKVEELVSKNCILLKYCMFVSFHTAKPVRIR